MVLLLICLRRNFGLQNTACVNMLTFSMSGVIECYRRQTSVELYSKYRCVDQYSSLYITAVKYSKSYDVMSIFTLKYSKYSIV